MPSTLFTYIPNYTPTYYIKSILNVSRGQRMNFLCNKMVSSKIHVATNGNIKKQLCIL